MFLKEENTHTQTRAMYSNLTDNIGQHGKCTCTNGLGSSLRSSIQIFTSTAKSVSSEYTGGTATRGVTSKGHMHCAIYNKEWSIGHGATYISAEWHSPLYLQTCQSALQ